MKCKECEMFREEVPMKVVDEVCSINCEEISHYEYGFQCTFNGIVSLDISDLKLGTCRCEK